MGDHSKKKSGIAMCVGCGSQIHDQYILRVSPDLEWHAACLKCAECSQYLDETCTCFVRDGKTYCKRDYVRLFGIKCAKCNIGFCSSDLVMRARDNVYHMECFRCSVCSRHLLPGDEFSLRDEELLCRADHGLLMERASAGSPISPGNIHSNRPLHIPGISSTFLQNLQGLTGTPLVAGSPIRHDTTVQGNPVEVQTYQPPWKALSEFALQSDLDQPAFQQLVSFSESGSLGNSSGSDVTSLSSQLPDTPNSMVPSPVET
ncbi:insulin gene enhancer protein isl-2a isoform X1 [Labeo rohita]|uniref:Insulin gene enhancer protein isl-2a isoform X1 n=2 Tax=Labeonini TaxID=2743697 RepID=A0A498N2Y4_LABRO|nr:insulin gene enhancer protein isl-2a isoform X1 [Labeo rohita]RXN27676.1 insulin gene enhancer protein isl-2a isoform X1 [Labeo rohita]